MREGDLFRFTPRGVVWMLGKWNIVSERSLRYKVDPNATVHVVSYHLEPGDTTITGHTLVEKVRDSLYWGKPEVWIATDKEGVRTEISVQRVWS